MDHGSWSENARVEIPGNFRTITNQECWSLGRHGIVRHKFVSSDARPGTEDTEEATPATYHQTDGRARTGEMWRPVSSVVTGDLDSTHD